MSGRRIAVAIGLALVSMACAGVAGWVSGVGAAIITTLGWLSGAIVAGAGCSAALAGDEPL
jgi:hypothetical protein